MPTINDSEFGTITVRKLPQTNAVKIRVSPTGVLVVTAPRYTPQIYIKRLINRSRNDLRQMVSSNRQQGISQYSDGMTIGKSHVLHVRVGSSNSVTRSGQQIIVTLEQGVELNNKVITADLQAVIIAAIRREAKSYLPKRLEYLAQQHGFIYSSVRFSHASSRWGSCSSNGTISLNIALMKLPFHLIDYVLFHELAHTNYLNHSPAFWREVERCDPNYKEHRLQLKNESPAI